MRRMSYIFLDESGDLGFDFAKKRTSRFFVITFLLVSDKEPIEKIVKKVIRSFTARERKSHPGVLHATKESYKVRLNLLNRLVEHDAAVLTIHIDKRKAQAITQINKQLIYNTLTYALLDKLIASKLISASESLALVASRRETNKFLNRNFQACLTSKIAPKHQVRLQIEVRAPHREKGLQVVDFVTWAIFRMHEYDDAVYYDIIRHKIIEERHVKSFKEKIKP